MDPTQNPLTRLIAAMLALTMGANGLAMLAAGHWWYGAVPGVTNSEGAEASWSRGRVALAASNGFAGSLTATRFGVFPHVGVVGIGAEYAITQNLSIKAEYLYAVVIVYSSKSLASGGFPSSQCPRQSPFSSNSFPC